MSAKQYPREWFRVGRWSDEPRAKMFDRETKHRLYCKNHRGRDRFENKVGTYHRWYPTREEAQQAIDARLSAAAKKRARIEREVACVNACEGIADPSVVPELLEALDVAHARLEDMLEGDDAQAWKEARKALPKISAALAKARGAA